LGLIQVLALLHQRQREVDSAGRVVASWADYAMARPLVQPAFQRAVQEVTEQTHYLLEKLDTVLATKEHASYADLMKARGWMQGKVRSQLEPALECGLVEKDDEKKQTGQFSRGPCTLEDLAVLPPVVDLLEDGEAVCWVDPLTGTEHHVKKCGPPGPE